MHAVYVVALAVMVPVWLLFGVQIVLEARNKREGA